MELDQESVAAAFDRHDYVLMPVVDDLDRFLGIITVDDVIDIIREEATEDAQKQVGAGGYEAVWSTAIEKYRGRTPWLMVSVLSLIPALGVVALFEETIERVAVLAVLMPLAAAITGNAGHQALAVTLRGITLNEMRRVRIGRLLRRELVVGLSSGLSLGLLVVALLGGLPARGAQGDAARRAQRRARARRAGARHQLGCRRGPSGVARRLRP